MAEVPLARAKELLGRVKAVTSGFEAGATTDAAAMDGAKAALRDLRIAMTEFPSLPPTLAPHPTAAEQQTVARSALEQACLVAVRAGDGAALERSWAQLSPYYLDLAATLPPSEDKCRVAGLYLLHLLVTDRLAPFHCELELLSDKERASAPVAFPALLQSRMTEGAYNRVLAAAGSPPSPLFAPMVAAISSAVRDDAARAAEAAYKSLALADAASMLHLPSEASLREYVAASHPDWTIERAPASSSSSSAAAGPRLVFPDRGDARDAIPARAVIGRTLQYANDMERIV